MTNEEAIKRAEIELICMECPTDKACYDSHLHSICEHNDIRENVSFCEALKVILSALKDRPKGKWIERKDEYGVSGIYNCSLCNYAVTSKYDFCTCGADMRGE